MDFSDEVLGFLGAKWNGNHAHVHSMGKTGIFTYMYRKTLAIHVPTGSMYGIFTYIYHKNQPNVGKYTSPMDP